MENISNEELIAFAKNKDSKEYFHTLYENNISLLNKTATELYRLSDDSMYDIDDYINIGYEVIVKAAKTYNGKDFKKHLYDVYSESVNKTFQDKLKKYNCDFIDDEIENVVEDKITVRNILKSISKNFSKRDYEIFYKRFILNNSLTELATEYRISKQRVSVILKRILRIFKEKIMTKKFYVYKGL